jgi:hypothetical protein
MPTPVTPHGWDRFPGLRFGHKVGSAGRGKIQLAVRRAFVAAGTSTLTTSVVFDYALARHRNDGWRRRHRWSVVRVLLGIADRVGRADTPGRPWLWRLKKSAADALSAPSD